MHPPSKIKLNKQFKTLRWRLLRWRLTLSSFQANCGELWTPRVNAMDEVQHSRLSFPATGPPEDSHLLLQHPRTLELIFKPREAQHIIDFDTWWTFRIFFLFFSARGSGKGSPRRRDGGGGAIFYWKSQEGGGGVSRPGGARGRWGWEVLAGNWGGGGGKIFFVSGPKFPPRTPSWKVSEGFLKALWLFEGVLKGPSADRYENPSKTLQRALQRPLQQPFKNAQKPFKNASETLLGSAASVARNESLDPTFRRWLWAASNLTLWAKLLSDQMGRTYWQAIEFARQHSAILSMCM